VERVNGEWSMVNSGNRESSIVNGNHKGTKTQTFTKEYGNSSMKNGISYLSISSVDCGLPRPSNCYPL
jgi:hypothetical protein